MTPPHMRLWQMNFSEISPKSFLKNIFGWLFLSKTYLLIRTMIPSKNQAVDQEYYKEKPPPEIFYKKDVLNNFLKFFQSLFFQLYKNRNSVIGVLLWILRNFQEHFFLQSTYGRMHLKKEKSVIIDWFNCFCDK